MDSSTAHVWKKCLGAEPVISRYRPLRISCLICGAPESLLVSATEQQAGSVYFICENCLAELGYIFIKAKHGTGSLA